ncbi:MAG TPA: L-serine ammonia-lyase [Acidocella sp.]|nr:L-serine ammonia-lyase [Acidocella sp.]
MISVFELFKVGIGPSSSHTMGPMRAARNFVEMLRQNGQLDITARVKTELLGSLAWTGEGHGSGKAVMLGLAGETPEEIEPTQAEALILAATTTHRLRLGRTHEVIFSPSEDVIFDREAPTPRHPNTLCFSAYTVEGRLLVAQRWCSVGGGFVLPEDAADVPAADMRPVPYPFSSGAELLRLGRETGLSIAQMVRANELALRPEEELTFYLDRVIDVMMDTIDRGMTGQGLLPGSLKVRRRAAALREKLEADARLNNLAPHTTMDWVSLFAIAVNEENAAGGRVVTAPTNGAAGVVPAVLRYYREFCPGATREGMHRFLLVATAIGGLFKKNASISGAEVGCQGEVGVAASMAAAGLAEALGSSNEQIENAAEIAMEHHLGMTCDPIGGLVQIPCIERNAFGAGKAISAASLARRGDGVHRVSFDHVLDAMRQTGRDMMAKYKETSQGGLALNFVEC